jgi:hypothetical protein
MNESQPYLKYNLSESIDENPEKPHSGQSVSRLTAETRTTWTAKNYIAANIIACLTGTMTYIPALNAPSL